MSEFYKKDAFIWIPDEKCVWASARILGAFPNKLLIQTDDGKEKEIKFDPKIPPPLKNPEILTSDNDLTSLSFLNEASVLETLKVRFCQRKLIYTYCGIVLVAINPYKELSIYGIENIRSYKFASQCQLDPHIFAVAENAVSCLSRFDVNQSIIISGESGAGKTVSAKYVMRYLANAPSISLSGNPTSSPKNGHSTTLAPLPKEPSAGRSINKGPPPTGPLNAAPNDITSVENQALASNPIMEAIGNAKTLRNDNSSRFGKYLQIYFNQQQHVSGAVMRTYLLEKSRVISQASMERNFHIFYQLCAASDHVTELRDRLNLGQPTNFQYLNAGRCCHIQGIDDYKVFQETSQALQTLGFSEALQFQLYSALAAILHFGNVNMEHLCKFYTPPSPPTNRCAEQPRPTPISSQNLCGFRDFERAADLLAVKPVELRRFLCYKRIDAAKETVHAVLSDAQAANVRDSLAKDLYSRLFACVVARVNATLDSNEGGRSCARESNFMSDSEGRDNQLPRFIGLLDIYGFEKFENNSFEQFCINYANEKLQQQFNLHVFKLEQEEYINEGLEWSFINYQDNQACIDLIEAKMGILHLLDEECLVPKGSDDGWCQKLYYHCKPNRYFKKPKFSNVSFLICHSSEEVEYAVDGFMLKNRDKSAGDQVVAILRNSENAFIADLYSDYLTKSDLSSVYGSSNPTLTSSTYSINSTASSLSSGTGKAYNPASLRAKLSVGSQFKDSLNDLMTILRSSEPHYIRCIKPNDDKRPFVFDSKRVVQQLRACGILETIRISAAGYPSRWLLKDFYQRYKVLVPRKRILNQNLSSASEYIVSNLFKDPSKYRIGRSKIFFRSSCVAHLENLLTEKRYQSAVIIQKSIKGWLQHQRYQKIRRSALLLQTYGRGYLARKRYQCLRRNKAATKIQTAWRTHHHYKIYTKLKKSVIMVQTAIRGYLARQRYREVLRNMKALTIQKNVRAWLQRKRYRDVVKKIVLLQCCVRRLAAKRALKRLKAVASTVEFQRNINKGLENKVIELKIKLDEQVRNNKVRIEVSSKDYASLVKSTNDKMEEMRQELKKATANVKDLETKLIREKEFRSQIETEIKRMNEKSVVPISISSSQTDITLEHMEDILRTVNDISLKPIKTTKAAGYLEGPLVTKFPAYSNRTNPNSVAEKISPLHGGYIDYDACYKGSNLPSKPGEPDRGLDLLLTTLFDGLNPMTLARHMPSLPAHIFIMCLRYADSCKDRYKADIFLQKIDHMLRRLGHTDCGLDKKTIWLVNTHTLLNLLKQYSGKDGCMPKDAPERKFCFQNIDFSKYYENLDETAEALYRSIICSMMERISSIIISAILENSILSSHYSSNAGGIKKRRSLNRHGVHDSGDGQEESGEIPLKTLLKELEEGFIIFEKYGLNSEVTAQIYRQIFYQIGAISLNILLQNKSYCNFTKGTQIRYNLSQVESFCRDHKLQNKAMEGLEPLMVASRLLQARKTANDTESICEMSAALKPIQVIHLLLSYTPTEEFEQRVPPELVAACRARYNKTAAILGSGFTGTGSLGRTRVGQFFKNILGGSTTPPLQDMAVVENDGAVGAGGISCELYSDLDYFYSISLPFVYSHINLETIIIPEEELGIRFAQI